MFGTNKKRGLRMNALLIRALIILGSLSALIVYLWGVQTDSVLRLIVLLFLAVFAMAIPAALFLALIKFISYIIKRVGSENS